jgi:hypothetical protein
VLDSRGATGHNVEYVLKLAEWIRTTLPEVEDDHLFSLEKCVRQKIQDQGLCLRLLMGHDDHDEHVEHVLNVADPAAVDDIDAMLPRKDSAFSSQVRPKCSRCVKV